MNLVVENLTCRRGGRLVFSDLSFTAEAGRALLVRGPNGVGKSSLLRVLAGFVPASDGTARIGELSLSDDRTAWQEQIAYAGHLDAIKPALTVAQNLSVWAGIFGAPESIAPALARFGLDALADRPTAQCSAGQKRRLGLARLLVMDRPVWLLDEPTVSLDAESAALVAEMVREHCAGGGLALIATHIDLGLDDAAVLTMTPSSETAEARQDAFLAGAWE